MANGRSGDDDRPKLSWSEIDKRRDKARSRPSPGGGESGASRAPSGASYSRFKSAADAFFSGNRVPDGLADKLDPTGQSRDRRDQLQKLRDTTDPRAFATAANDYVAAHGLFDDPYLLDRLLEHPDPALVLKALSHVDSLVQAGGFKVPRSMVQRLRSLDLSSDNTEIQDAARALSQRIAVK